MKSAVIKLENGKTLTIEAKDQSEKNVYVSRATLNGKRIDRRYITHAELINGGVLLFQMDDKPGK